MTDDKEWEKLARSSRDALALLGHELPDCMPGEPHACGATFQGHALAHMAALSALAGHSLAHMDYPGKQAKFVRLSRQIGQALAAECECHHREHHHEGNSGTAHLN